MEVVHLCEVAGLVERIACSFTVVEKLLGSTRGKKRIGDCRLKANVKGELERFLGALVGGDIVTRKLEDLCIRELVSHRLQSLFLARSRLWRLRRVLTLPGRVQQSCGFETMHDFLPI